MNLAHTLTKWLMPSAALFMLAGALFAPAGAGSPRRLPAPQEEKQADVPDDSVVRGRAVYDDTSRPVRRARVLLITDGGGRREYGALTDAHGDFQIKGVRAGAYYAFVDVPGVISPVGFVSLEDLRASPGPPQLGEGYKYFDRFEVDGKQDATVTVHARRGGAISGRVSYADGDPAVNVSVTLMRRGADGRVQKYLTGASLAAFAGLRTDDRGMFRLIGLPPGEYLIGVNEAVNHGAEEAGAGRMGDDVSGAFRGLFSPPLLMTFYPSATSLKEAGSVKVEAGDEHADVDITIPERELRTLSGVVRARRGGRPVARAHVTLARRDDPLAAAAATAATYYEAPESDPNATTTDEGGRWQFKEIPDGAYVIHVKPPEEYEVSSASLSNSNVAPTAAGGDGAGVTNMNTAEYHPPRRKRSFAPTQRNLEVSADVSEFVVEVADGARIAGTVSVEGGAVPRFGYISLVRVADGGAAPEDVSSSTSGSIDGGRFVIEGLSAGKFFLQAGLSGEDRNVYLKSINWNGRDLLREPLELTEGASAEGVRIVFARNPATLNVTVRGGAAAGKRPPNDLVVTLVPADLSAWVPGARPIFCMTGVKGTCPVVAPPGEYRVVLTRRTAGLNSYEQEVRRRVAVAPRVTLREGETSRIELEAPDN
ncbi:MAG: hypothetical protein ACJ754_07660 [Pyrinomonadaceae bacterium]